MGLFMGSIALIAWEADIYDKTFIPLKIPLTIWFFSGFVFTLILKRTLAIYIMATSLFLQIFYNLVTWGGLITSAFILTNYYFASKAEAVINENIISTGHLNSRSGHGRPFIIINHNEQEKELVYNWKIQVELYKTVDLTISHGLFGFDIIRYSEFKTK